MVAPSLSPSASEKVYAAVMVWPTSAVPEMETPLAAGFWLPGKRFTPILLWSICSKPGSCARTDAFSA